ncbi:MAG: DUF86 domain-containing protein [bacterium]
MMGRTPELFINDIIESINNILEYTNELDITRFSANKMAKDAVIRNFEVIGEATKNLPEEIKAKQPAIPWKEMAGMRDKMIHEYFGIDVDIVWQTVKALPDLLSSLQKIKL